MMLASVCLFVCLSVTCVICEVICHVAIVAVLAVSRGLLCRL